MKGIKLFLVLLVVFSCRSIGQENQGFDQSRVDYFISQAKLDSAKLYIENGLKNEKLENETDIEYQLVKVLFMQSSYSQALEQSFSSLDKISESTKKVKFNFMVGCIYSAITDHHKSVHYFDLVAENSRDTSLLVQTYLLLSQLHTDLNDEVMSGESLVKAYELTQSASLDPRLIGHVSKQYNFHVGNYERCKAENLTVVNDSTSFLNSKSYAYSMIGDCLMEQDSLNEAATFYDEFFELTLETKDPEQIKVAVKKLIEVYEKIGDQEKANSFHKIYNQVLADSASFSVEKYRDLYDIEKNRELKKIKAANKTTYIWIVIALICLAFIVFFWLKRQSYKKNESIENASNEKNYDNKIVVSDSEILKISSAIEKLKAEKSFLNSNITRKSFCSENEIKSERYLSHFINSEYEKSFSVFLNDLRIEYAYNRILSDSKFRSFKIEQIAKESGFGSRKSFERAFTAKYSETPFKVISRIES